MFTHQSHECRGVPSPFVRLDFLPDFVHDRIEPLEGPLTGPVARWLMDPDVSVPPPAGEPVSDPDAVAGIFMAVTQFAQEFMRTISDTPP